MDKSFFDVPDALWRRIEPLLPREPPKPKGGRPRVPDRVVLAGILYRVRTGCQWKALPKDFGSGSTCHLRMQQWVQAGVFAEVHKELLRFYERRRGIRWSFASLDSALVKAPKGGATRGRTRRIAENSA
jgi:transposase